MACVGNRSAYFSNNYDYGNTTNRSAYNTTNYSGVNTCSVNNTAVNTALCTNDNATDFTAVVATNSAVKSAYYVEGIDF